MYASHLALIVRGRKGAFELRERYAKKRLIGRYRSVDTLERGIYRHNVREHDRLKAEGQYQTI